MLDPVFICRLVFISLVQILDRQFTTKLMLYIRHTFCFLMILTFVLISLWIVPNRSVCAQRQAARQYTPSRHLAELSQAVRWTVELTFHFDAADDVNDDAELMVGMVSIFQMQIIWHLHPIKCWVNRIFGICGEFQFNWASEAPTGHVWKTSVHQFDLGRFAISHVTWGALLTVGEEWLGYSW